MTSEPATNRRRLLQGAAGALLAASSGIASEVQATTPGVIQAADRITTGPSIHKQRAIDDHRRNVQPFGGSLASPIGELLTAPQTSGPYQFDVLIIGSGYGGAVCAARLSEHLRQGNRLCVMERGREWVPGTFPDSRAAAAKESRFDLISRRRNKVLNPLGLYNSARFDEVDILAGNGLGGGSLINAGVAYRPEPEVFATGRWPRALLDRAALDPYYDRAAWELGAATEPLDHTPKMRVQRKAAERLQSCGAEFQVADVALTRGNGSLPIVNRQGWRQRGCIDCGDCTSGCNVGAKNTLAMNYLPLARRFGAEIYTQCEAERIEKCEGFYRVHYRHFACADDPTKFTRQSVAARIVIVSAGSLGSTELLLRSQHAGFGFSSRLGHSWTANGDAIGFVRKIPDFTNIGGRGAFPSDSPPVGPTIQTNLTLPSRLDSRHRILIQEGTIARAYANILGTVLGDLNFDQTMLVFAMGHDEGTGRITLDENGYAYVRWPGLRESAYRRMVQQEFDRIAGAMGGTYRVLRAFGDSLVTVHPLGGCNLADDAACGVVDEGGRVFDPATSGFTTNVGVHEGLYVADGSIIPSAIGVNPFMTIAALAERIADRIRFDPRYADLFA